MIKKILLLFLAISLMLSSCKKDSDSDYLEVTINGKTYRDERPAGLALGNYAGDFCGEIPNVGWNIAEIDLSELLFTADLATYEYYSDFQQSSPGSHSINDAIFLINQCNSNLDLVLQLNDNTLPEASRHATLQSSGRIHQVTVINRYRESDFDYEYIITGTFSCTFKNYLDQIYSVSGKYRTTIIINK